MQISVILPIHNAAEYLPRSLANLGTLDGPEVEFVVIDDHSTDGSAELAKSWTHQLQNVTVISSTGRGVAAARNQAVRAATGDYLWFADCDDDWQPDIVSAMLHRAESTGADVVVCNAQKITLPDWSKSLIEDSRYEELITGDMALARLLQGMIQGHLWNKLFRRGLIGTDPFPATRAHSDLGGMFALLQNASVVALLPRTLYTYYVHQGSILNGKSYRWDDLWDCLALAETAAIGSEAAQGALITFKYRNVIIPSINESVRREGGTDAQTLTAVRHRGRRAVRLSEVLTLLRAGQRDAALRAAMIKYTFPLYRVLYKRHRSRTWAAVDSAV